MRLILSIMVLAICACNNKKSVPVIKPAEEVDSSVAWRQTLGMYSDSARKYKDLSNRFEIWYYQQGAKDKKWLDSAVYYDSAKVRVSTLGYQAANKLKEYNRRKDSVDGRKH